MDWSPQDAAVLQRAARLIECNTLSKRFTGAAETAVELVLNRVPEWAHGAIHAAVGRGIEKALDISIHSLDRRPRLPDRLYRVACGVTGAVGGSASLVTTIAEIPVTTIVMLRSVADIARHEGEDLADPATRLHCLAVLALAGGTREQRDSMESYWAARALVAGAIRDALPELAGKGLGPALRRLITVVAERFSVAVSEKVVAQIGPVVGALAGAGINLLFMDRFQDVAHGHFTLQRLVRKYGEPEVRARYERIRAALC